MKCLLFILPYILGFHWVSGGETEKVLMELGIELPKTSPPVANYVPAIRTGNLVYLSGAIARNEDGSFVKGKIGRDFSVDEGYEIAREIGISLLAALLAEVGDLDTVASVVRVEGFVNCGPEFDKQSLVVNGVSDLFVQVFGEAGKHTRIAVGAGSLPLGAPVEISAIVEVSD